MIGTVAVGRRFSSLVRNVADKGKGPGPYAGRYTRDSSASFVGVARHVGGGSFPGISKSIGVLCG